MGFSPDYSTYSYQDLVDACNSIDQDKFPERYEELKRCIEQFKASEKDQTDGGQLANSADEHCLEFKGKTAEYFSIWIVNVLLTIITLGIYSAWAKVRSETYFYGNTFLDDSSFRYHAKPLQILKGRIFAFIIFLAYYFAGYFSVTIASITFTIIALLMPAFMVMSMAFKMRNSSYRNVRFNFDKDFKQAYKIFLIPFILIAIYAFMMIQLQQGLKPDVKATGIPTNSIIMMLLPLLIMLMYPLFEYYLVKFRVNHSSYGTSSFEFNSKVSSFYKFYIIGMVAFFIGIILTSFALASLMSSVDTTVRASPYRVYGMMIPMMAIYLWFFAYVQTKRTNLIYSNTKIECHQLQSNLKVGQMTFLYFTNTLGIAFSLGLATPWAMIRTKHYKASCTSVITEGNFDEFVTTQSEQQSAYGEEIGDMFDMDLGF